VQTDIDYRVGRRGGSPAGYIYDDGTVTDGGVLNAALVGKVLQQVPKHHGTCSSLFDAKSRRSALGVQSSGCNTTTILNVNLIPVATLADAGYSGSYPAGCPGTPSPI